MRGRFLHYLLLLYTFSVALSAGAFNVDVDVAQFRFQSDTNYLEIYYAFDESQLSYSRGDEAFEGGIILHVTVRKAAEASAAIDKVWQIPHAVQDTAYLENGNAVVGVVGLAVPIGAEMVTVETFDVNLHSNRSETSLEIESKTFHSSGTVLSDVELCSSVRRAANSTGSIFYKNTFEVVPNPGRVYGDALPSLNYYVEAYNLLTASRSGPYHTKAAVTDRQGNELLVKKRKKRRSGESSIEIGFLNVSSLARGIYNFEFSITDSIGGVTVSEKKEFYILGAGPLPGEITPKSLENLMAEAYGTMTPDDMNREFNTAGYIASDQEKDYYASFSAPEEKRRFLFEFWERRDPSPGTVENEMKREYLRRAEYADQAFSTGRKEGWQTDRGRVYIIYGPPDEYDRHAADMAMKPYEIWFYHELQGGVRFVFGNLLGFRDYILIHSTHRDELRDDNWEAQIREN